MARKMYRTHRLQYGGAEVVADNLRLHCQLEAMQGPAGWVTVGPIMYVDLPLMTFMRPDVTEAVDRIVRKELSRRWTLEREDGLF